MPNVPSLSVSITNVTDYKAYYESKEGMNSRIRRQALERSINANEQKLGGLDITENSERSKLNIEISRCKTELSRLEKSNEDQKSEETAADIKRRFDSFECQTCKNRRYKDESDDSGVSFQTASHIDPSAAYSAVRSHENEHVARNRTHAEQHGQKIAYQTVTIHHAICPECGRSYVSGGVTHTVTKADNSSKYTIGNIDLEKDPVGSIVNVVA